MLTIEILALLAVIFIGLKMFTMLFFLKPSMNFGKEVLKYPKAAYYASIAAAVVVLYFLTTAGVGIIEILAVMFFTRLLYGATLVPFAKSMYKVDVKKAVPQLWLSYLFVLVLLVWGLKELFF